MSPFPSTPRVSKAMLQQQVISDASSISSAMLQEITNSGSLDEISNAPGSVRWHICRRSNRDPDHNTLRSSMLFFIYQTTRHGPQNGFRLCMVRQGYYIGSDNQSVIDEDDIDLLEKPIPQGHKELAILGVPLLVSSDKLNENSEGDLAPPPTHDARNNPDTPTADAIQHILSIIARDSDRPTPG
ncbi:hypothetical protein F4814DRAFT_436370 [Daldinia grandis]|nr:hypothetical protein F4814DRAFT_436370 [Daldinia grandis]